MSDYDSSHIEEFGRVFRDYGLIAECHKADGKWYLAAKSWNHSSLANRIGPFDTQEEAVTFVTTIVGLDELPAWAKRSVST